jgi:hypothetical protein
MIQNDAQLQQSQGAAACLERSLALLKKDQASMNPARYALMAGPIIEDLRRIRQSIDEYVGAIATAIPQEGSANSVDSRSLPRGS